MATYQWDGYGPFLEKLRRIGDPDPTPLLVQWERIIDEDNRRGVMAGVDCFDQPMAPVKYRPVAIARFPTARQKNFGAVKSRDFRGRYVSRGIFAGMGPHPAGTNNNLTPAEYRQLGGPPLAPRGGYSRVITNFFTGHGHDGTGTNWYAEGRWFDVKSVAGADFLQAHFNGLRVGRGAGFNLPRRDLRGVRQWGMNEALDATRDFGAELMGSP